jgi:TPR repeat protein
MNLHQLLAIYRQGLALNARTVLVGLLAATSTSINAQGTNGLERIEPNSSAKEPVSSKWATVQELTRAAEDGNSRAQVELAAAYMVGLHDLPQDKEQGLKWARRAAFQGDNMGQWFVGQCLQTGNGTATNLAEAADWFTKSAQQNNPLAQMTLGLCYLNGQGVATNKVEGFRWLQAAADTGAAMPQFTLGFAYQNEAMLGAKAPESAKKAAEWFTKAADQGLESAQFFLGQCYQYGRGVDKDLVEAYKWMLLANHGNPKGIPGDLLDQLSARQLRKGLEFSKAFVPRTNAVTFQLPPMLDWLGNGREPSSSK